MAEVIYIMCPMCLMNRVLDKKGSVAIARGLTISEIKGRIRFDQIDLNEAPIVQVRERKEGSERARRMRRGGGTGFVFKRGLTLDEMKDDPKYQDLIKQMKTTAGEILRRLE